MKRTVATASLPHGWRVLDTSNGSLLARDSDNKTIRASSDPGRWGEQIGSFEFIEGTRWVVSGGRFPQDMIDLRKERDRLTYELGVAGDRLRYLEAYVKNMPNAESVAEMLAAKDERIAELNSQLASTPVAFEDPDAKPRPVPGFLRAIRTGNKAAGGLIGGPGDKP